jgi:hypothetical protein
MRLVNLLCHLVQYAEDARPDLDGPAVLQRTSRRIREYAGTDPELMELADALERVVSLL